MASAIELKSRSHFFLQTQFLSHKNNKQIFCIATRFPAEIFLYIEVLYGLKNFVNLAEFASKRDVVELVTFGGITWCIGAILIRAERAPSLWATSSRAGVVF